MEALHKTRVASKRLCTCWKEHRVQMCNLAFEQLDMTRLEVVEVMKNWVLNGDSVAEAGDRLYDMMWLSNTKLNATKYFAYSSFGDGYWNEVWLLRQVGEYPPYTRFDFAKVDTDLNIVFGILESDVTTVPLHM